MNVIMLLTNPCDPDVRVIKEAVYISERGHNVTILCWDRDEKSELPQKCFEGKVKLVRFRIPSVYGTGYKQLGAFFKFARSCKAYLKKKRVDVFHCHDLDGYIAYRLLHMKRIPYIWDMHENYIKGNLLKRKVIQRVVTDGIGKSRKSIYVTNDVLKVIPERVHDKMLLLRNYPDPNYLTVWEKTKSEYLRIGYHGTLRRQIPEFSALFEACKDYLDVRIDINGGGIDLEELQELAKGYSNVYVHGPYDGLKDSNRLYENTDVLFCGYDPVNPNYQGDTEVIKFYEAIITGTPMIMTKSLGMGVKVRQMGLGALADTRDSADIRRVVGEIRQRRELLQKWRNNMRKVTNNYRWDVAVKILDKVY